MQCRAAAAAGYYKSQYGHKSGSGGEYLSRSQRCENYFFSGGCRIEPSANEFTGS
jgi:hypothetical protein